MDLYPPTTPAGEGSLFLPSAAMYGLQRHDRRDRWGLPLRLEIQRLALDTVAFPSAAIASAICVPNADNVYVGVTDGRVYHTSWSGAAWTALTALTSPRTGANVGDILVSSANLNRIWSSLQPPVAVRVYH